MSTFEARTSHTVLRIGAALLLAGLVLVFVAAWREQLMLAKHPGNALLIAIEAVEVPEDAVSLETRPLPESNLSTETQQVLEQLRKQPESEELIDLLGLAYMERLFMVDKDAAPFTFGAASGRLPQPGQPEVLAGALARFDTFEINGIEFKVVGHLDPLIPGVLNAYFLPAHETFDNLFTGENDATSGWLDAEGLERMDGFGARQSEDGNGPRFILPAGLLPTRITGAAIVALLLVAAGGAMVQIHVLRNLAGRGGAVFGPFLSELTKRPKLLLGVHLLLYGALFVAMAGGTLQPRTTLNAVHFTQTVFSEGDLGYIGRAYESGNILMATLATLNQNYLVGTCLYSVLPSLLIPFAGVFKNVLSFAFVGFVMAPLWTGTVAQNTYHSITLTLELEAYVLVSFAICVLPIRVFRGFQEGTWATEYVTGLRILAGAVISVGALLTIAALYEATTLILLN